MAIPMICGFEPVVQPAVQMFVVPAVPTTMPQTEQQYAMFPSCNMWGVYYGQPGSYGGAGGMDSGYAQGMHRNSPTRKRAQKAPGFAPAASFEQLQESDAKDVTIVLGNLPKMLCKEDCFQVALDATQVQDAVRLFSVEECGDKGEAVVILKSEVAAQIVMKHFRGIKTGRGDGVTARYSEEAGKKLLLSKEKKQAPDEKQKTQGEKQEQIQDEPAFKKNVDSKPSPSSAAAMLKLKIDRSSIVGPSSFTRTNPKKRWADIEDDSDSDHDNDGRSTATGLSSEGAEWFASEGTEWSIPDDM